MGCSKEEQNLYIMKACEHKAVPHSAAKQAEW